jgi:hypothetical protein
VEWVASKRFTLRRRPSRTSALLARAFRLSELPPRSRGWGHARSAPPPEARPPTASKKSLHTAPEAPTHTEPKRSSAGIRGETKGLRLRKLDVDRVRCGHCEYEAAQYDRFCAHCGASLSEARAPRSLVVMPAAETSGWETCKIDCWHGDVKCDFYARGLMPAGDGEVSRSPPFWWWHRDPSPAGGTCAGCTPGACRATPRGWLGARGARRPWYAQRFRRSLDGSGAPASEEVTAPQSSRAGRAQLDVPLGDGDGELLGALGRGAADRRGTGTAVAAVGLPPLSPQDGARDRRSRGRPLCCPSDELARESGPRSLRRVHRGEVALRHGAGVEEETQDAEVAYARAPKSEPTRDRDGWLPST